MADFQQKRQVIINKLKYHIDDTEQLAEILMYLCQQEDAMGGCQNSAAWKTLWELNCDNQAFVAFAKRLVKEPERNMQGTKTHPGCSLPLGGRTLTECGIAGISLAGAYLTNEAKANVDPQNLKVNRPKEEADCRAERSNENTTALTEFVPKKTHANTHSKITNDLVYLHGFENICDSGYTQLPASPRFNISFAGLMPLIVEVDAQLCSVETDLAKHLPLSAFSYYIIMHLWGRIAAIRRHHGRMTPDEWDLLELLSGKEFLVPEPIAQYFRGIGDLIDSTGVEYLLNLVAQPTADKHGPSSGWAGRVTEITHNIYESIPMPGVAVARLCADMAAGKTPASAGLWLVPDSIRPMEEGKFIGGYPTANLLGYGSAVVITQEQMKMLSDCGISPVAAKVVGPFARNDALLTRIAAHLANAEKSIKMVKMGLHDSRFGSQALMGFVVKENEDINISPLTSYYANNTISTHCSVKQDDRFSTVAKVFTYRIKRDTFPAGINQWSCFEFNNYQDVPASWVENRNELFDDVLLWNISRFSTSFTNAPMLRLQYVDDAIIKQTKDLETSA